MQPWWLLKPASSHSSGSTVRTAQKADCRHVHVHLLLEWIGERGMVAWLKQRAQLKNGQAADYATLCPYGGHPKEGSERPRRQQ